MDEAAAAAAAVTERVQEDSPLVMDVTASQAIAATPRCWRACWNPQEAFFSSIIAC